jgi:hypothetical protein
MLHEVASDETVRVTQPVRLHAVRHQQEPGILDSASGEDEQTGSDPKSVSG